MYTNFEVSLKLVLRAGVIEAGFLIRQDRRNKLDVGNILKYKNMAQLVLRAENLSAVVVVALQVTLDCETQMMWEQIKILKFNEIGPSSRYINCYIGSDYP